MSPRDSDTAADLPTAEAAAAQPAVPSATPPDPEEPPASDLAGFAAYKLFKSEIIVDAEHALHEEYKLLFGPPKDPNDLSKWLTSNPRYALCLSGGGIRSAAFCMGALRALAARKLLTQFHYLSTVSGGGYIGGWLQCLIKEARSPIDKAEAKAKKAQAKIDEARAKIEQARARSADPQADIDIAQAESEKAQAESNKAQADIEKAAAESQEQPVMAAQSILASSQARPQVKNLRDFTNFLAPSPGLLSGDVMPGVVLYLRNVIVNWMIFLPTLLAVALVPTFYRDTICALSADGHSPALDPQICIPLLAWTIGLVALGIGVYNGCKFLPTHAHDFLQAKDHASSAQNGDDAESQGRGVDAKKIDRWVVAPVMIWALAAPIGLAAMSPPPEAVKLAIDDTGLVLLDRANDTRTIITASWHEGLVPAIMVFVMVFAYWRAKSCVEKRVPEDRRADHAKVFDENWLYWSLASFLSGSILFAAMRVGNVARAEEIAAFGPLLVLIAVVLQTTFYIAVRRDPLLGDLDREWLARLNASILNWGVVFAAVAACSLIVPYWLLAGSKNGLSTIGSVIGLASGPIAALLARKAAVFLEKPNGLAVSLGFRLFDVVALLAALLFAASLIALLSWMGQDLVDLAAGFVDNNTTIPFASWLSVSVLTFLFVAALGGVAWWLGRAININRFSMHSVYRNRIVRAFLGSSRDPSERQADRYVRFDPNDNPRMTEVWRAPKTGSPCLFPVIGATLNLSGGTRTAWTERKAAPFTITPLRCGSAELNHPQIAAALRRVPNPWNFGAIPVMGGWTDNPPSGAYASTDTYAGAEKIHGEPTEDMRGLSLGTAIALSGAAISSNMGSRSSSALAFLATLFDLRLGMWLPNPGHAKLDSDSLKPHTPPFSLRKPQAADPLDKSVKEARDKSVKQALENVKRELNKPNPMNTTKSLFTEMFGDTDDEGQSIYLTDGGHFDNLGLYEMLRRRCKCILVIDVGNDPGFAYDDLGSAVRRANLDFDACVTFTQSIKIGQTTLPRCGLHASILYPARDNLPQEDGHLLIIKPWLPDDTPAEVFAYKASNGAFPHDSTANQFFRESQFESYRRLGEHITACAIGHITDVEQLFASVASTAAKSASVA